jgi:D-serine deaminase-like pyridoxal phosphate-dependent protein
MKRYASHLMLDEDICKANISRMATKARNLNLKFRPHFKTHQSATVAEWFRQEKVDMCTVSSLPMAEYFAQHGWDDICISTPLNFLQTDRLLSLASIIRLSVTVCDEDTVNALGTNISHFSGVYIKTDTGYGRAGIYWDNLTALSRILNLVKRNKGNLTGFLVHDGHTYSAGSTEEIEQIRLQTNSCLRALKQHFHKEFPELIASVGDTPSCSICTDFEGIDEIRPGNFVFFDLMQWQLKSCSIGQIALKMICPVVSMYQNSHAVIHCGAVHLSKESIDIQGVGKVFGKVFLPSDKTAATDNFGWITSLSQEHGKVIGNEGFLKKLQPGIMVTVLPVHSCLAATACGGYYLTKGGYINMMKYV